MGRGKRLHMAEVKLTLDPLTPSASPGQQSGYVNQLTHIYEQFSLHNPTTTGSSTPET